MHAMHKSILTILRVCILPDDGLTIGNIFDLLEPDEKGSIKGGRSGLAKIIDVLRKRGFVANGNSKYERNNRAILTWIITKNGLDALGNDNGLDISDTQERDASMHPHCLTPAVDNQPGGDESFEDDHLEKIEAACDEVIFMDFDRIYDDLTNVRDRLVHNKYQQEKIINKINELESKNKLIQEQQKITHIKEKLAVIEHCRNFFIPVNTDFSDVLRDIANDLRDRSV